jgi:hypothetical protein
MAKAIGPEVVTVDFKAQDVCKTIQEAVPGGLDGMFLSLSRINDREYGGRGLTDSLYRCYYFPRAQDYSP